MPIGTSKVGALGGLVPGGSVTFNASGNWPVPPGVKKVSITGKGGTGNPGNSGNSGNAGNPGSGGSGASGGGGGTASPSPGPTPANSGSNVGGRALRSPFLNALQPPVNFSCPTHTLAGGAAVCVRPFPSPGVAGSPGQTGDSGSGGSAGSAGNAGQAGNASSGLGFNFAGGGAGNAGAAGNAGTAGSGGAGGTAGNGGGTNAGTGGAGGTGATAGRTGANASCSPPTAQSTSWGGGGGGGAGSVGNAFEYNVTTPPGFPRANNQAGSFGGAGNFFASTNPPLPGNQKGFGFTIGQGGIAGNLSRTDYPFAWNVCPGSQRMACQPVNSTNFITPGLGIVPSTPGIIATSTSTCPPTAPILVTYNAINTCQHGPTYNPLTTAQKANITRGGAGGGSANAQPNFPSGKNHRAGGGGGGGGRGNAGNAGGGGGAGGTAAAATPTTHNCVTVTPGATVPITVASPGGQIVISWNPQ